MGFLVENTSVSLRLSLTALRCTGFWPSESLRGGKLLLYNCYGFICFMFLLGIFIITEVIDLYLVWGNLPLMTGIALLLFTNLAQATKIINIVLRRKAILKVIADCDRALKTDQSIEGRTIVESCNRETRSQQLFFYILTIFTCAGWAGSAEKNKLPITAWYPYDTSNHPAYEITYVQQVSAIVFVALLNVSKDTLVTTLIAQCRCSLRLVGLSLRNIHCERNFIVESNPDRILLGQPSTTLFLTRAQETEVQKRLRNCVIQHQDILETALLLQNTFSEPIFAQFNVSLVIICTTAFQLVSQTGNFVRLLSMGTYLLNMIYQVFIYCYQGNQFSSESEEVARAAYDMPWYSCSVRTRRSILIVMVRCRRIAKLTAGGFTTLSLTTFMAVIKTSYSLFTLLQQVTK